MKFLPLFRHDGLDVFNGARHGRREVLCAGRRDKAVILHAEADAAIFGEVSEAQPERGSKVFLLTACGGSRRLDMLVGEQLPRIC